VAAYRRVYDLRHLLADCQEPGSAPVPYARYSSMGYLYLYHFNQLLKIVSEALLLTYLLTDISMRLCHIHHQCCSLMSLRAVTVVHRK